MSELRLSATALQNWEECKTRFLFSHIYGLQRDKDSESQRIGTNWGACHEIIRMVPQSKCPKCLKRKEIKDDCYLCNGTGVLPDDMMDAVIRYLDIQYSQVPEGKTAFETETERVTILYSFCGYQWYYSEPQMETLASEVWFDVPVVDPENKRKLKDVRLVGKVDHLMRNNDNGLIYIGERKSTSKDLTDNTYWDRLRMDIQLSTYLNSLRVAQRLGQLGKYGVSADEPLIQGTWYDVWHKPGIKPKALSQKDTKEFLETGCYADDQFEVVDTDDSGRPITVNGIEVMGTMGKSGNISIHETPEMYGARLMVDIAQRPEHYFVQREIPRSDQQLREFESKLAKTVKAIRYFEKEHLWTTNCQSCRVPFWCDYLGICENNVDVGPTDVPEGFKKRKRGKR